VLWKVDLEAPVGPPSIADINGDGQPEVLVSTQDGWLYVLAAHRQTHVSRRQPEASS
jgi:hypothetical protein